MVKLVADNRSEADSTTVVVEVFANDELIDNMYRLHASTE